MSTWIFAIDKSNPQHWAIARREGYWDMKKAPDIAVGDRIVFWQAQASLLGGGVAVTPAAALPADAVLPWNDQGRDGRYRTRVHFETESVTPAGQPSWSELQRETGVTAFPNFGPIKVTGAGEAWLLTQAGMDPDFGEASSMAERFLDRTLGEALDDLDRDARVRVKASIVLRQGQRRFRRALLTAYGRRCAVTGAETESLLDAAHIRPYLGTQSNNVSNGVLLRTDIHTLFDLHLLTLMPDRHVRVSPDVRDEYYRQLDGSTYTLPVAGSEPAADCLARHNAECSWLGDRPTERRARS